MDLVKIWQGLFYSLLMNFMKQDFELGFALFKTPAGFLVDASLIPCASFTVGGRGRCLACWHFGGFYFGGRLVSGPSFYGV